MGRRVWLLAIGIGIINALLLFGFEFIGVDVTNWLWDDLFHTDTIRWLVLPVAVVLGLALTATIKLFRERRVVSPESDILAEVASAPQTLPGIGIILAIGGMSLLAGGSIGPEASLMAASAAIGAYVANEAHLSETKRLLVLASIGALLVAFLGSLVVVLVPLLMLRKEHRKQSRHLPLQPVLVILLAAVGSLGILELLNMLTGKSGGYGTMPTLPHYAPRDFIVAVALGFVAAFIALSLTWLIQQSWRIAQRVDSQRLPRHEYTVGATFAAVLGGIYLFGGRTIEFSGSIGSNLLIDDGVRYGVWALLGLIGAKLLATAWSKGTGYRGGLVFPSIYTGIALGLAVGHLPGGLGGAGAIVGGISGVMSAAVGSPMVAGIFLVAILPVHLWPVAACAIVGTVAFDKTRKHLFKHPTPSR